MENDDKSFEELKYKNELKQAAFDMFVRGANADEIADHIHVSRRTVYNWRAKNNWDAQLPNRNPGEMLARRIAALTSIDDKSDWHYQELEKAVDAWGKLQVTLAQADEHKAKAEWIRKNGLTARQKSSADDGGNRDKSRKPREKKIKNDISSITPDALAKTRAELFTCGYHDKWLAAKEDPLTSRIRFILKSRQIGATFYFAWEAFEDAVLTGDNQIFLSASRAQADVFKGYIVAFALKYFEVELKGVDCITLSNGANLRFLSTNATTAQSYTGHLYIDEVFWIPRFQRVNHVAGAIATHKKWRKTYFSTPSAKSHEAFPLWNGETHNAKQPESKRQPFDVSHAELKDGKLFKDRIWRHIVTAQDAVDQGFDLIDVDLLRDESPSLDAFDNLYMCKFIDDSQSVFNLESLLRCVVEADAWDDYNEYNVRPFGNKPVAIGYDSGISASGDAAQRALLSAPIKPKDPFRLLSLRHLKGKNFEYQANRLQEDVESHNVDFIGMDVNGIGMGVYEHVQKFYPSVTPLNYSPEVKNRLITKMLDLISTRRFQILQRDQDVISAFMLIKQSVSNQSSAIIYKTERRATGGHGDSAWAIINGVSHEPLAGIRDDATLAIQR